LTCAEIETAIRCVNSINENCAASAIFVGDLTLDYNGYGKVYSDEPCFHQRFDEYFNQDGLCSFQDVKNIYKYQEEKYNQLEKDEKQAFHNFTPESDERICKQAQFFEKCVKEVHESCIGFFHRQLKIVAQGQFVDQGETIPQCIASMLNVSSRLHNQSRVFVFIFVVFLTNIIQT